MVRKPKLSVVDRGPYEEKVVDNWRLHWHLMIDRSDLTAQEKQVACILATCRKASTGQCNPSSTTLARYTGLKKTTIFKALAGLVEKKVIVRQGRCDRPKRNYFYWDWAIAEKVWYFTEDDEEF